MSTRRIRPDAGWGVGRDHPRGPNGRLLCRKCGTEVPKGRRTFCSDACVHEWKLQTDSGYIRDQVYMRDKGVCAECGLDTDALRREVTDRGSVWYRTQEQRDRLAAMGFSPTALYGGDFWQADHRTAVVDGGGCCGLDNLQTLCTGCHKRKTTELAQRRAAERRASKERTSQPLFAREDSQ